MEHYTHCIPPHAFNMSVTNYWPHDKELLAIFEAFSSLAAEYLKVVDLWMGGEEQEDCNYQALPMVKACYKWGVEPFYLVWWSTIAISKLIVQKWPQKLLKTMLKALEMKSFPVGLMCNGSARCCHACNMAFVGQTMDSCGCTSQQSFQIQKIWDATSTYEYEMTATHGCYKKVHNQRL